MRISEEGERMILEHIPLAKSLSRRFATLSHEDRLQEALLGLVKAYKGYNQEKGVTFGAYAKRAIMNQLKQMYNREIKWPNTVSFYNGENDDNIEDLFFEIEHMYERIELEETLKTMLGDAKAQVAVCIADGKTQVELSEELGISQSTISRMISETKEKLGAKYGEI